MINKEGIKVIIAGGGTGGHLFPGIAIAEEFMKRSSKNRVLFIGTRKGIEKKVLEELGFPLRFIDVEGIKRRGILKTVAALLKLPKSFAESRRILKTYVPHIVVGVGGYASGPAVLMAVIMGIPSVIAEQNAIPGMTNRILGHFVDRVFLSFPDEMGCFDQAKVRVTGNPVRSAFLEASFHERKRNGKFTILVFGGSQGARTLNRTFLEALNYLEEMRNLIRIVHQTGEHDLSEAEKMYRERGFEACVFPFTMDMARAYAEADLLVCRAGASTVAEITIAGKASILVPYPYAVNDHQAKNAEYLAREGAAILLPEKYLTGERLANIIIECIHDPQKLSYMEERARSLGKREAAKAIVDECLTLLMEKSVT
ncbi:MAG: undecaprenyldiphospho-muramoylpentapeptide beta-N-acetylglucosaminyltransferase [Syntrophales bacterium]|nr:undecaprenyldiphospho-muramoylpentapeptide beta-N-acetylglucosaminyltransferase [Syntrophales bacterium]